MTSEEQHGISPQPPETCPIIDRALGCLESIDQELHFPVATNRPVPIEAAHQIAGEAEILRRDLEALRQANEAIRRWGQEWKDLAKRLSRSQNPESIYRKAEASDPAQP